MKRAFGIAALLALAGCARSKAPPAAAPLAEADPVHDTIGEFRRSERVACAEGTDLVYVVSRDGALHSFDPSELRFRRIGRLECPGATRSLPQSMAVDRSGQAWVGYDNGVLALASIANGDCIASRVNVHYARIGTRFGMGFAPTAEGGIGGETLFLSTEPAFGRLPDGRVARGNSLLVRIDDGAHIRLAGAFPSELRGLTGELSSRSDGKLFAFFTGEPFSLAEIDPATAGVRWQKPLEGMRFRRSGSGSWAFAAVGAEFFFFWADNGGPSTVTRLREDGTLEHVIPNAGIEIVGAGASTCATAHPPAPLEPAPLEPPPLRAPRPPILRRRIP
ncbi:MAG: hypothetical protein KIT84_19865 [Labilithrix sp.]|nr:hypothetical protein [Labilithrix sp.]MCW5813295.1 hypothetical protein [Labilithrix sp.]